MARIAGVNLPNQKRLEIGLTYIYGIGQPTARKVAAELGLNPDTKVKDLTDEEVTKLRNYIDSNLGVPIRSDDLARTFGVSPRTLDRRFQAATHATVNAYLQQARILLAKRLLETTDDPIEQIRAAIGYLDPASFRRAFRQAAGMSPRQYRSTFAP